MNYHNARASCARSGIQISDRL